MLPIKGYEEYHVNMGGMIIGKKGLPIFGVMDKDGYIRINLSKNGKGKLFYAHRLIAQAYLDNPENLPHVNHINGIRHDNCIENLEWLSVSDNIKHSFTHGKSDQKAEKNAYAKLTNADVLNILDDVFVKKHKRSHTANKYKVCPSTVGFICNRKTWRSVTDSFFSATA